MAQAAAVFAACGCGSNGASPTQGHGDAASERSAPPTPYARPDYQRLSGTELFADIDARVPGPGVTAFEPTYKLWSDGADKRRWIRLPPGTQIDSTDMDHWVFPIGTKLWKEFSRDGVLLETRLIERYGEGPDDYWMGAFAWEADQSDAVFVVDGQKDIAGTIHDAPAQKDCDVCHRGDVGRVLGFSAVQLSGPTSAAVPAGPKLADLKAMDLLSHPPAEGGYPVPGDADTAQALGYLHANCGHCHNKNGTAWHDTQMVLRLRVADSAANTLEVCASILAGKLQYWRGGAITMRVAPGQPDASAIVARMQIRGSDDQMPSLATELVDPTGLATLRRWIAALGP
ncbi:MAG: hypothetical protein H7X95_07400 [Deltaproteobacteria bacterium]|nr:hypothetical protein [Deltaproteobacteria bacterium]